MKFIYEIIFRGTPAVRGQQQNLSAHYIEGIVRDNLLDPDGPQEVSYGAARPIVSEDRLDAILGQALTQALAANDLLTQQQASMRARINDLERQIAANAPEGAPA